MPQELVYTSAPRGLRPGASGYCTVAQSAGLPTDLVEQLERLSRYRHLVVGRNPVESGNPVVFAHAVLGMGPSASHVLSRIADIGLDYSGRSNYLAHHHVLAPRELPPAGPAWVLEQSNLFVKQWDGQPEMLPPRPEIPGGRGGIRKCKKWAAATGDAGWAGVLAKATDPASPAYIIYEPGQDALGLISESLALLPAETRWQITFSTYFTGVSAVTTCQWRCVPASSDEAREVLESRRGLVIRADRSLPKAPEDPLVEAARTGVAPVVEEIPLPAARVAPVGLPRAPSAPPRGLNTPLRSVPRDTVDELPVENEMPPAGGSLRGLAIGLSLGMLLAICLTGLVELAADQSLTRMAGLAGPSKAEVRAESEVTKLSNSIAELQKQNEKLSQDNLTLSKNIGKPRDTDGDRATGKNLKAPPLPSNEREIGDQEKSPQENNKNPVPMNPPETNKKPDGIRMPKSNDQPEKEAPPPAPKDGGGKDEKRPDPPARTEPSAGEKPKDTPTVNKLKTIVKTGVDNIDNAIKVLDEPIDPKSDLDVIGLTDGLTVEKHGKNRVTIRDDLKEFQATLKTNDAGTVELSGKHLNTRRTLGFGILRVKAPDEAPSYYQLFEPIQTPKGRPIPMDEMNNQETQSKQKRFHYDIKKQFEGQAHQSDFESVIKGQNEIFLGNEATIQIGSDKYPMKADKNHPINKPSTYLTGTIASCPAKLKITKSTLTLELDIENAKMPITNVKLANLSVFRTIRELPGYHQEILRIANK